MMRTIDFIISLLGLFLASPILLLVCMIGFFDTGSPIFIQVRVGRNKKPFKMVKFRTMRVDTASVASHLADKSAITQWGFFLRHSKIDELPQLWNVLKGEMSLVGPRPCLFNQHEIIKERELRRVFEARPGITGMAQINKIDMSKPRQLAEIDELMLKELNIRNYIKYIALTIMGKGAGDGVISQ